MLVETGKRTQPPWKQPEGTDTPKLKLYNSLTRQKEEFVPQFENKVLWYSCGPTVYDASHMGHARSYISFDILRRVLSEYFSYDVFYVMNITDIDDKIIKRARQSYLFDQYLSEEKPLRQVIGDIYQGLRHLEHNLQVADDGDHKSMLERLQQKAKDALNVAENTVVAPEKHELVRKDLIENCKDVLLEWLDSQHGTEVMDNTVFSSLPAYWEERFYEDMEALNVLTPHAITRVSEYVPEIVSYIQTIMNKGMAYASKGSVYFDTIKFDRSPNHFYGKLVPEAFGDRKSLEDGEGILSVSEEQLNEKQSSGDFALWKASKPGEPAWDSPWGKGRPGWHIECSVMASVLLGESLDIHTGGFDLKFPHHDNELAQAEAFFDNDHWVRYFLHSGHLTISGCKMSKSLKNFITIKEALSNYSAQQLRLAFLLHSWKDTLDYSVKTMDMAVHYECVIQQFFLNIKNAIRNSTFKKWDDAEIKLNSKFQRKQAGVHSALCDNVDTRTALDHLRDLISSCNVYLNEKMSSTDAVNNLLLKNIASYVTRMFKIFGVIQDEQKIGFPLPQDQGRNANVEEVVLPYLSVLAEFRETVRQNAKEMKVPTLLKLCDELRDEVLPELGVRLEDHEGKTPAIKIVGRDAILQERAIKLKIEEEKRLEKERQKRKLEEAQSIKDAQRKVPPWEMFRSETDKYSKFDEKGIPTHDAVGKELSKGQVKKLQKLYQAQEKKYDGYLKNLSSRANGENES